MSFRNQMRTAIIFAPLALFVLAVGAPIYSARMSLSLHGHPFARIVPKDQIDVFHYVDMDSFECSAIVLSGDVAVGWIDSPEMSGFPRFVPFSGRRSFDDQAFDAGFFEWALPTAWFFRWWLLAAQAILFIAWPFAHQNPIKPPLPSPVK